MAARKEHKQMYLVGEDVRNPMPKTIKDADAFLRKHCRTSTRHRVDHDLIKTVLTSADPDGEELKTERQVMIEIELSQQQKEQKIIELAQLMHRIKTEVEMGDYSSSEDDA